MKRSYSETELEMLNFSLLDLIILQTLYKLKQQITRHKLLLVVQRSVGKSGLSTARFYRILNKLENFNFVYHSIKDANFYFITPEGIRALNFSKGLLDQIGLEITTCFANDIAKILEFANYTSGKVLFVDFHELYDFDLIDVINQNTSELSVLCTDEVHLWLSDTIKGIKQTRLEEGVIKEPDNSFKLIILFYPGNNPDNMLYKELFRILKTNRTLLVIDSVNPLEEIDHFASQLLFKRFLRIQFSTKENLQKVEKNLETCFNNNNSSHITIKGLELLSFVKN